MNTVVKKRAIENYLDSEMHEVPKDFFFEGMQLHVTVYLQIKPQNYLVIGRKGERASLSDLHVYHKSNSRTFVKHEDYSYFILGMTDLTNKFVANKSIPAQLKTRFVTTLANQAVSTLVDSKVTTAAQLVKVTKLIVQISQSIEWFDDVYNLVSTMPDNESKHSMSTCLVALCLCDELKINLPANLEKVAVGALLHDVGLRQVSREILEKPRHLWTDLDLAEYQKHPVLGAEALRNVADIPTDVMMIVSEHHENSVGTGFPHRKRDVKLSNLSKIVSLANTFANLIGGGEAGQHAFTADEAIQYIDSVLGQPFNRALFVALKNMVNKRYLMDRKSS